MKILRLRLTNLNSLRGENAVDFTASPLGHAGLFAITGPTGAGKTTLLDAITLALYGRVARYGKDPSPDAVMSRHTGECSAEVEFACASGVYRGVWQLQRARKKPDGKLQPAKRRIIALPAETIVAESIKDSDAKILELTGLDYDRFLRSVLLAQGDFAAFLKAGPKERTELLQEVTGTAIYRDISQHAYRVCAEAQQTHADLLRDHQAVAVLDAQQREQHEAAITSDAARLADSTALITALRERIRVARLRIEIDQETRRLEIDDATHAKACTDAEPALARLAAHEKAAPHAADLATLDRLAGEQSKETAALRSLEATLPELADQLATAIADAENNRTALVAEDTRQAGLRTLWAEVNELDKQLATARETLRQLESQHAGLEKAAASLAASLTAEELAREKLTTALSAAREWLAAHAADARLPALLPDTQAGLARWSAAALGAQNAAQAVARHQKTTTRLRAELTGLHDKTPPLQRALADRQNAADAAARTLAAAGETQSATEIETRRDRAREHRQALEKLVDDAVRLRALIVELAARREEATANETALTLAEEAGRGLKRRVEDLSALLEAQRGGLTLAEKVQSLEGHRSGLRDGQPCPLCGALHHPYATVATPPADDVAAARKAVRLAEKCLEEARRGSGDADKKHAALLADRKRLTSETERLAAERTAQTAAWNSAATPCSLGDQFTNEPALTTSLATAQLEEKRLTAQLATLRAADFAWQTAREALRLAQAALDTVLAEIAKQQALLDQASEQAAGLEVAAHESARAVGVAAEGFGGLVAEFVPAPPADLVAAITLQEKLKARAADHTNRHAEAREVETKLVAASGACANTTRQLVAARTAAGDSLAKVIEARAEGARQLGVRREKFGDRVVTTAQQEAERTHAAARAAADTTRAAAEKRHAAQAAAVREKERLAASLAARADDRQQLAARLCAAANAARFADESALRAALLPAPEVGRLAAARQDLEELRVTLAARRSALVQRSNALPAHAAEDAPRLAEIEAQHAAAEDERGATQGRLGALQALLKNDDEQRARQAEVAARIDAAHRDFIRWDKLRALIGSADGSLFARFAQGLTLERLAGLANRHLAQLNPRYSIRRARTGDAEDLELEIVDHYQADAVRPMRSLSGGESFLTSLGLALGLSELAGGRTRIESLFIDEGFGTLDADSLEIAMAALEALQAGGKSIGVISHVPAMQERIATQIKITKESGGCSRLTLVG